jgi:hypothetical protein
VTLDELRDEFAERGFNHFSDTRKNRFINAAYLRLVAAECWPFRESSVTGTSPVAISDLGVIEAVIDTNTNSVDPSVAVAGSAAGVWGSVDDWHPDRVLRRSAGWCCP